MDALARATRARQRVLAVFNARQSDFESLRAWNDHLERVETLIFNLTEGVDVSALHVPAGHNLGGRGPGEIALSVMAEIVAEGYGRPGGPMRD